MLDCKREPGNAKDRYAVAVKKDVTVIGHLPKKNLAALSCVASPYCLHMRRLYNVLFVVKNISCDTFSWFE